MDHQTSTSDNFRNAWKQFVTGVAIITTGESESFHGMTANAIASVCLAPPLVLLSVGHERNTYSRISQMRRFGISILRSDQQEAAYYFNMPNEERPIDLPVSVKMLGGSYVIADAIACMDCAVVSEHVAGDHTIFIAEVEAVEAVGGDALVWYQSKFGSYPL